MDVAAEKGAKWMEGVHSVERPREDVGSSRSKETWADGLRSIENS